jgi:hypothetical protein
VSTNELVGGRLISAFPSKQDIIAIFDLGIIDDTALLTAAILLLPRGMDVSMTNIFKPPLVR